MQWRAAATSLPLLTTQCGRIWLRCLAAGVLAGCAAAWAGGGEAGPKWSDLTPAQRTALRPLERDWTSIEPDRKEKWIEIAGRMPGMPATERERIQARMTEWARLSPQQRGQARLGFQEAKELPPQDRHARWEAYQSLTPEQKKQLQSRAGNDSRPTPRTLRRPDLSDTPQPKSNIVPNPAHAAQPKPVGPTVMQARPGATTNLLSERPAPPPHQQIGLPKIAASPGFVDKSTLLPQRGPQGAATRAAPVPPAAAASTRVHGRGR
jgi:hypothetical protein